MNVIKDKIYLVFLHYSVPSIFGMLAISSASIIDGLFVGKHVGAIGLAAINITFPIFSLLFGIALMLGVGSCVTSGKLMGEGDSKSASDIFTKTFIIVLCFSAFLSLFIYLNITSTLTLLGANKELLEISSEYLSILLVFMPFLMIGMILDYFVKLDRKPLLAFAALFISALSNIFLDWLFIVHFQYGISGAALATGISYVFLTIILLPHFFSKDSKIKFIKPLKNWSIIIKSAFNGASEFVNEISIGITTLIFNFVMINRFGVVGVAAFTIINYLLWLGVMISFAISDSLQPIISKNHGAQEYERINRFINIAIFSVILIGSFLALATLLIPDFIIDIFLSPKDINTRTILIKFMLVIWPVFFFHGTNMVISAYFTSMHKPIQSALIAISRSLILPVFLVLSLPIFFDETGIFISIVLAEFITFILALIFYIRFKSIYV